jgi:hypothetical protein
MTGRNSKLYNSVIDTTFGIYTGITAPASNHQPHATRAQYAFSSGEKLAVARVTASCSSSPDFDQTEATSMASLLVSLSSNLAHGPGRAPFTGCSSQKYGASVDRKVARCCAAKIESLRWPSHNKNLRIKSVASRSLLPNSQRVRGRVCNHCANDSRQVDFAGIWNGYRGIFVS